MRRLALLAAAVFCIATTSCATARRTTVDYLYIITEPAGAHVATSVGQSCTAPCTLILPRRSDFDVTITLAGYHPFRGHVTHVARRRSGAEPLGDGVAGAAAGSVAGLATAAETGEAGLTLSGGLGLTETGGAMVVGAAAVGVIVPILVDASTGANRNLSPNPLIVRMTPMEGSS
jgi:hypothetical protein